MKIRHRYSYVERRLSSRDFPLANEFQALRSAYPRTRVQRTGLLLAVAVSEVVAGSGAPPRSASQTAVQHEFSSSSVLRVHSAHGV